MFSESTFSATAFSALTAALATDWAQVNDSSSVAWVPIPDAGTVWTPVSTNTTPWTPVVT